MSIADQERVFRGARLKCGSRSAHNVLVVALSICCVASVFTSGCWTLSKQKPGDIIETWETKNNTFRIRVTAYDEKGAYPAPGGGYYVFESSPATVDDWHQIINFRADDPIKIPRDQVRFVSEPIGYVFMGWLYAVTTDGGRTWSVWDASKDASLSRNTNYDMIQIVNILPNGTGDMLVNLTGNMKLELKTTDYGRHWSRH
jgi:photosystem II stability/assembly factor-like uncharacterized protein